jgi:hypothetical protein
MENIQSRKKLSEMTVEERRTYNAQMKQRSRQRQRQRTVTPTADEWADEFRKQHPGQATESDQYANEFAKSVLSELQIKSSYAIDACLDQVTRTSLGLKRNWVRDVQAPNGEMVAGMYFADSLGETIVRDAHVYGLEQSPTFSAAYRELLEILDKKYGHEQTKDARVIRQELLGEYMLVIPVKPEPAPKSAPEPQPDIQARPAKTTAEILADGRANMMRELEPYVGPEARNFLYGN